MTTSIKTESTPIILIISHAASVKNTTDHFRIYLINHHIPHYYLRHPFVHASEQRSVVLFHDGQKERELSSFSKPKNGLLLLIYNVVISQLVVLQYGRRVSTVIGVGGFNIFPAICWGWLFKYRTIFWGVDYSIDRFHNTILNWLYMFFETVGSTYSRWVIQPTTSAEQVRMEKHGLTKERSIVFPNGVDFIDPLPSRSKLRTAFVYIGSITEQHGIVSTVDTYYVKGNAQAPLYIFGGGSHSEHLSHLIKKNNIEDRVHYMGYMDKNDIDTFLRNSPDLFIGFAPYRVDLAQSHTGLGDSIKIKEYIALGIPFLTSTAVQIPLDLCQFGVIYCSEKELEYYILNPEVIMPISYDVAKQALIPYSWDSLCARVPINPEIN